MAHQQDLSSTNLERADTRMPLREVQVSLQREYTHPACSVLVALHALKLCLTFFHDKGWPRMFLPKCRTERDFKSKLNGLEVSPPAP